jgi:ATP-binding cassette, subfamily B, bacterial HlyB/CyaB
MDAIADERTGPGCCTDEENPEHDPGLLCLVMLARLHEVAADPDQLAHQFKEDGKPFSKSDILLASKHLGLQAKAVKTSVNRLDRTPLPAIAIGNGSGFFIIARCEGDHALTYDPAEGKPQAVALSVLQTRWSGELILFASRASLAGEMRKFDFTWFIPSRRSCSR